MHSPSDKILMTHHTNGLSTMDAYIYSIYYGNDICCPVMAFHPLTKI
nr:MAG TPA: hypothetical protein [Caudoviricetes sp.]